MVQMETVSRALARVALVATVLGGAACASLGTLDDVMAPGRNTIVDAEVRSVDNRAGRISLREYGGRSRTVRYDRRTSVVYRQRSYPVTALERGDRVNVRVSYDRNGQAWANRIDVRESVRDRGRIGGHIGRIDGTVARVDSRERAFSLAMSRNRSAVVYLPRNASRSDRARFDRLRRGDRVRADVREVGRNRFELVRFR
jgi:hypothetical protein